MIKFRMPLLAVRDVEISKKFYHDLFDQEVVLDLGGNVTFSGGFAVQQHKRLSSADIVISNPGIAAHDEFRFITEHIYFKPFLHCSTKSVG